VPLDRVPPGPEGTAYLDALKVTLPPHLEHQQLEAGAMDALRTYRTALEVEELAANIAHQFDVQVNGRKAAPARIVLTPAAPDSNAAPPVLPTPANAAVTGQDEALSRYFGSETHGTDVVGATFSQARTTGGPSDVARQIEAERQRELAAQQTRERAEQQQAAHAQLARQQAARAAAAEKARQCTSSLLSRAVCASQGYNPLTGQK
jgi:hypothetical protein